MLNNIKYILSAKLPLAKIIEMFLTFFLLFSFIMFTISLVLELELIPSYNIDIISNVIPQVIVTSSEQDPVRWWPSGTPQSWGVIGTALAAYRLVPGGSRQKGTAALATLGVTVPMTVFAMAVENPNGFNRLMFSWVEYKKTGTWGVVPNSVSTETVKNNFEAQSGSPLSNYENAVDVNTLSTANSKTELVGGNGINNLTNTSIDSYFKELLSFFKLESLDGYFDELYGFIWFSQVLLLIISVSLLILFVLYVFNNILIANKEAIINRVNDKNKILKFYVKYQLLLSRISFYFLPLLIIIGLLEMIYISNYLISHPLPLEKLPIDTHVYISNK